MCSMCGKAACDFTADSADALQPLGPDVADHAGTQASILPGATYLGTIDSAADQDWIAVTLQRGVTYSFDVGSFGTGASALNDPTLALLRADGTRIAFNDDFLGLSSHISFTADQSGVFYLDVGGFSGNAGNYALSVSQAPQPVMAYAPAAAASQPMAALYNGPEIAGSTSTTATIGVGSSVYGAIDNGADQDWYRIDLVAGTTYEFRMHGVGTGELSDPFLGLRDGSGNAITSNDDSSSWSNASPRDSRIVYTATTTGTHYLNATSFGGATGDFLLSAVEYNPFGMVFTVDEIAWQLTNNFAKQTGGAGVGAFNVGVDGSISVNLSGLDPNAVTLSRNALQAWTDVTGIRFVEVTGAAEITFFNSDPGGQQTTAYAQTSITNRVITSANVVITQGWMNQFGSGFNSYTFETYIHEIGHALGLGHGGNYNGSATYGQDNYYLNDSVAYAIMSYMNARNDELTQGGTGENYFVNASFRYMVTPAIADIVAIHNLYGDNSSTRTGNTTYGFNSNTGNIVLDAAVNFGASMFMTIYDDGGLDTLDFSGASVSQIINLAEESFSNVLGGVSNLSIARGTVVERAFGGSNTDILRGNAVANTLEGRGNNDALYGEGGDDTLDGGAGNDTLVGSDGADWLRGGAGTDIMTGGSGADRYDFNSVAEIGNAAGSRDIITDFQQGFDQIDLNDIDALTTQAGNQKFIWMGTGAHTGAGATLRYQQVGGNTLIYGDVDANGSADFTIELTGLYTLTAADFTALSIATILGTSASETIVGAPGGKFMNGMGGNDVILAGAGADTIRGGAGFDTISGGAGADRFVFASVAEIGVNVGQRDVIADFQKNVDKIDLDAIDALTTQAGVQHFTWISGNAHTGAGATLRFEQLGGNTLIHGDVNADGVSDFTIQLYGVHNLGASDFTDLSISRIQGNNANNILTGAPGGKTMLGLGGNDTITGGTGADTIVGGAGADSMTGGAGADRFVWNSHTESGNALADRDIITDFQKNVDKIDLSGIDANTNVAGNQAFTWLGTAVHTGAGATLRYSQVGGNTLIYGDIDGDKAADFTIQLTGLHTLASTDFAL